jgi:large subunit ribosomal protein L30
MAKLVIKQIRSGIDCKPRQKSTLVALGFRKLNHSVELEDTPQIRGMIRKVNHLVTVSEK